MAMMVTIPPSCLRPPPDPPPPSFLGLMQHCSSSLKMMVTALPPLSQPRPPSDSARNKHLPIETPPVEPRNLRTHRASPSASFFSLPPALLHNSVMMVLFLCSLVTLSLSTDVLLLWYTCCIFVSSGMGLFLALIPTLILSIRL
ncbi:hypothetical protein Bca52824_082855 [Brassica carinata]|uniref:Uncharacterized protein n=1 Tax=Brassica carinata TaxID=52824 RepID=A0A8X7TT02_BRACI|nr:hypothetical protein Bca52824_082855 [Brassica carinata]